MTIPLPPLPDSDGSAEANKTPHPGGGYEFDEIPAWSETLVRAIQREAMRVAIEAAARVCEEAWPEMHKYWGPGQARAACEDCASAIRALEIGPGEGIENGVARIAELITPDCRTCASCYRTKGRGVFGCDSIVVCVNANRYQPTSRVEIWGME